MLWTVGFASADPKAEIGALMTALSARGQFNGTVLVAQEGKTIYRNAFGKAIFPAGTSFTPETPSNIGSVTKQFTAMAIMILAERNKLQYDDPVVKYIPEFSRATHPAIQNIFGAKSYVLPKQSGAEELYRAIHDSGIQAALKMYEGLKAGRDYDFGEAELNTLGYQLLYGDKKPSDAVAIFRLNTAEHPASSNDFDSLGEAYSQNGQKGLAIQSYQTAVKLDPTNGHAVSMLKQLQ
jgi:hypothetical protein